MRAVFRIAELVVEHFHDREADVQADQVAERERAHRVVRAELHGGVDALDRRDALGVDADRLVDHPG